MRVAKFVRTSTDLQHKSIENQEEILDRWIKDNKCILYKTYSDEGISGTKKSKRIQWLQMIEDAKSRKFDIMICKSYSRFGRNQIESLEAIKTLRENNIRIVFLEDGLDSMTDTSRFGLMAWLAEEESKRTSVRIKGVQKHFRECGKIFNCIPPYGYDYDLNNKKFVVNIIEAKVVKEIFKLYIQGNGVNKIAKVLKDENIPTKNGGVWRGNTIKNIILNESYLGTLVQGKSSNVDVTINKREKINADDWIKHYNKHEAIIDKVTFIKANNIFKNNSLKAYKARNNTKGIERASNSSLFSNLVKCSCGTSMSIRRKKGRKPYYNCIDYERIGTACGHSSNSIREDYLIEFIYEEFNELISNNFNNLNIKNKNDIEIALNNELKIINGKIEKQVVLSNNLLNLFSTEVITIKQCKLQNESINNTLEVLMKNKEDVENKIENLSKNSTTNFKRTIKDIVKLPIEDWNNSMLKEVIDKIVIDINGTIKIYWSIEKEC
ncbi:recombinase family protein [Clostridium perfringens]|uniref:recombinase family protein n=1 Tax=Clostridium perfringens TaxID=1502 RepID=UPI0022454A83|nr:recombinase family protein [Clostridium perfringens]MCX0392260.1 recombinase family protein [Clostridium perfringens]